MCRQASRQDRRLRCQRTRHSYVDIRADEGADIRADELTVGRADIRADGHTDSGTGGRAYCDPTALPTLVAASVPTTTPVTRLAVLDAAVRDNERSDTCAYRRTQGCADARADELDAVCADAHAKSGGDAGADASAK